MRIRKYNSLLEESNSQKDMFSTIPQSVKELHSQFKDFGFKLFVVGGAVRDFFISQLGDEDFKPKDFDLATDATPDDIIEILQSHNYRFASIGKAFGVIMVYTEDQPDGMEIATFRDDQYGDKLGVSRNPEIKFSTIEKDVERRDITFNSMFYDLDRREIIDMKGGIKDIEDKIVRFVGDADLRIKEDPLRILRIIRFAARYQFDISDDTIVSIMLNKNRLNIITKERIWEEFKKGFKNSKIFTEYLDLITRFDLWEQIFPGARINTEINPCDYLVTYLTQILKWNSTKNMETKMVQNFKIESEIATKVVFLINLFELSTDNAPDLYKEKIRSNCQDSIILDWLRVNRIKSNLFTSFIGYKPTVSAEDLMSKGFKGKELGIKIRELEKEKFKELLK